MDLNPGTAVDFLSSAGVTGLSATDPGQDICSGCYSNLACAVGLFSKVSPNTDFDDTLICSARDPAPRGTGQRIILYGDCSVSRNRDLADAVRITGCPPSTVSTVLSLMKALLSPPRILATLLLHSPKLLGLRLGIYSGNIPKWKRYRPPQFDRGHFR